MRKLFYNPQLRLDRRTICRPARSLYQLPPSFLQLTCLTFEHTEQEECICVTRIQGQHLQIYRFRRAVTPGAVVLRGNLHHGMQNLGY